MRSRLPGSSSRSRSRRGFAASAWRPQEALQPFIIDWSIRQMNLFAGASPVQQGDGSRAAMDFALITGDQADNMQRNEILWTRALLEGGSLEPNSGSARLRPTGIRSRIRAAPATRPPRPTAPRPRRYTGVQDYADYDEGLNPYFYDPTNAKRPLGATGRSYPGLMDRAQLPFQAAGLSVPSYVTNGNHDGLVQGNQEGNAAFEDIATGCFKALGTADVVHRGLDPNVLLSPSSASCSSRPTRCGGSSTSARSRPSTQPTVRAMPTDTGSWTRTRTSTRTAPRATTPGTLPRRRASASSRIDTLSEGGIVEQVVEREHRRSAVPVAPAGAGSAASRDKLIVRLRSSPGPRAGLETCRTRRGSCTVSPHARRRARARPEPRLRHRPAQLGADPLRGAQPARGRPDETLSRC